MSLLAGGFTDPATQSAHAFRALLEAMARPGRIFPIGGATPPAPLSQAAGAVLLTLADPGTPLHLAGRYDSADIRDWIRFHTGAPLVTADQAIFALGAWADLQPLDRFAIGDAAYPDRSATLIVEREALAAADYRLRGPGIETEASLNLPEAEAFQHNNSLYPLGFDVIFTSGTRIAALPRSTRVEAL